MDHIFPSLLNFLTHARHHQKNIYIVFLQLVLHLALAYDAMAWSNTDPFGTSLQIC